MLFIPELCVPSHIDPDFSQMILPLVLQQPIQENYAIDLSQDRKLS